LKLLCNFYNLLKSGSPERFSVLLALIEYARDTKQVRLFGRRPHWAPPALVDRWFDQSCRPVVHLHPLTHTSPHQHPHPTTHHPQLDVLADFFAQLDEWKQRWGTQLTVANERQLYLLVSETLEAAGGPAKASEAHRFLIKYLATFTDEGGQDLGAWFVLGCVLCVYFKERFGRGRERGMGMDGGRKWGECV
jgi:hypothetical protein